ncbi:DUF881 domain-containing protein [Modestobacter roseus]|uniref:Uncharacterized protein YlxW (UPF0749 family) n=1 Tax=Modestobacter roseus TaxID=1181884 RepID=A0A562IVK7_9ACTN|nr:DUF881 domain-containing protein [Modestobacter roseus]TWH74988.1 uncharacterized protein YlxW (UPF0749 family) [Modestobacter roseus]
MARWSRPTVWTALVPVVALAAGLLFATSERTALGTDLRSGEITELSQLIRQRDAVAARQQEELVRLQAQVQALTDQAASRDGEVAAVQAGTDVNLSAAGLTPVRGAGVQIVLDDARRPAGGGLPPGATVDSLVIHQSDVQGVVNALWAAGADGVAIMGQRLIATSAVRCVGNTLLLQGRTYSPPFVITAVGDSDEMREELAASRDVTLLRQAADLYGLTYRVSDERQVALPAYEGPLDVRYAQVDAG